MWWVWFSVGVIVGYIMTALMVVASREDRRNERRDERVFSDVPKGAEGLGEGKQNMSGLQNK